MAEDVDAVEVADALDTLEVGPGTRFTRKAITEPSLKVTVAVMKSPRKSEGTEICSKFPLSVMPDPWGSEVTPVGRAPGRTA